jgi:hypothetical protein
MNENGWDEETAVREVMKDLLGENNTEVINAVLEARKTAQSEENDAELVRVAKEAKGKKQAKAIEEANKKKRESRYYTGDYFQVGKYSFSAQGHKGELEILKRSKTGFLTIKVGIGELEKTIRRRPAHYNDSFMIPIWNGVYEVEVLISEFNSTKL